MTKPGRNDPCPCGSGKKFKKCCEGKLFKGKFEAKKIEAKDSDLARKGLTSFFQSHTAMIPKKTEPAKEEDPEKSKETPQEKEE